MDRIRAPLTHVVLMDGTFASLAEGRRSSIGQIRQLLRGAYGAVPGGRLRLHYTAGQQWNRWRTLGDIAMGRGLEAWISGAYGWLASGYLPGDRVFLLGYSRGAFAVRSLAGMIGRVGLLRADAATERNIRLAWRYYRRDDATGAAALFRRRRCHPAAPIRMVGCFDTVMALGLRLPLLWMLTEPQFRFHDAHLGAGVDYGYQALALDETRAVFAPQLWDDASGAGHIEQMWFKGCHADIGGQLAGLEFARPLANIPLVWMLERAGAAGLPLPDGWRAHFPCDATAPGIGSWRNWGKFFLARAPRLAGQHPTEALHPTVIRPYPGPALLTGHLADQAVDKVRRRGWLRAGQTVAGK
ncbi:MAG: DUF2235 domain-containing protein [Paracoccus sp. (in: a-proteobacteria)]|uniref:DUF2235 domain-containing protein n=1 Tax=Paracoccus sp. TaxID=267 RepID=UPI0026DEAED1|nr:DUF2235 domain-containing protein [Paracoccus sp. (in: a-proteobacteria)]MDO5613778.1 DUF2235 domain-containing protein [Paracoccus sp. (in: a-proteobacteria)]